MGPRECHCWRRELARDPNEMMLFVQLLGGCKMQDNNSSMGRITMDTGLVNYLSNRYDLLNDKSWLKWILLLKLTNHNRLRKKSCLPSRSCTYPQSIKHYFLLIIHKATLLILLMPFWSPVWILVLEEQNHVCKMDGTCEMDRRLLSQWSFLKIIPPILVSQKG